MQKSNAIKSDYFYVIDFFMVKARRLTREHIQPKCDVIPLLPIEISHRAYFQLHI